MIDLEGRLAAVMAAAAKLAVQMAELRTLRNRLGQLARRRAAERRRVLRRRRYFGKALRQGRIMRLAVLRDHWIDLRWLGTPISSAFRVPTRQG